MSRPALTFLKSFPMTLWSLQCSPHVRAPINKEDKDRQWCEFNFFSPYNWWGKSGDLYSSYLPFDRVSRLQSFWLAFQTKLWDAITPWEIEQLCIHQAVSLMSVGVSHSSPTCLHDVNNNNGNIFLVITTYATADVSCTSVAIFVPLCFPSFD